MFWRLIDDIPRKAFFNMALDEAISESVKNRLSPPTLRLYLWSEPSVSIGYFQKTSEINVEYCEGKGYPIVRRSTGGTAILHDSEITYSLSARTDIEPFRKGLLQNYMAISNALVSALRQFNLNAEISKSKNRGQRAPLCFKTSSYGEISVNGQKIIGSAQRRYKECFLQQGTILFDLNERELIRVIRQKSGASDVSEIGTITKFDPSVTVKNLKNTLKNSFENIFNIQFALEGPTEFEMNLAGKLEAEKYSTKNWNYFR